MHRINIEYAGLECLRVVMEFWMSCISYKTDTEKRKGDMKLKMLTYCCHVSSLVNLHTMNVQNEFAGLACIIINEIDMPKDKQSAETLCC